MRYDVTVCVTVTAPSMQVARDYVRDLLTGECDSDLEQSDVVVQRCSLPLDAEARARFCGSQHAFPLAVDVAPRTLESDLAEDR